MIKTQDKGRDASMPPFNQPFEKSDPCFLGTNSFPPLADLD
jgi:hypothetical protein